MKYALGCVVSAMLGGMVVVWMTTPVRTGAVFAQELGERSGPGFPRREPNAPRAALSAGVFHRNGLSDGDAIGVAVYDRNNKSVVNITTKSTDSYFLLDISTEGAGSGSVIDKAGHILTNFHVIEKTREIGVTLYNGKTYETSLVGADPPNDIAVLKINAPKEVLFPVTFGDSSRLRVGMQVFAIGNPFGLERTMTSGIISSLNRSLRVHANRTIKSIIQTDASVNPGNSGGPLFDSHGRLIGMNTAIASKNGQSAGIGFSIPVNLITRVTSQLLAYGRVVRPEIGIQRVYETDGGLLIEQLTPGGPAERAGLRGPKIVRRRRGPFLIERVDRSSADLIVAVDGRAVKTADDFLGYIESRKSGDRVVLSVVRRNRRLQFPVTLGGSERPSRPR